MRNVTDEERKSTSAADIEAVITSYNQGTMILEAVQSLYSQTVKPARILIVDDGSTDAQSVEILKEIEEDHHTPVPVEIVWQSNSGVSAARQTAAFQRREMPGSEEQWRRWYWCWTAMTGLNRNILKRSVDF